MGVVKFPEHTRVYLFTGLEYWTGLYWTDLLNHKSNFSVQSESVHIVSLNEQGGREEARSLGLWVSEFTGLE